MKKLMTAVFVLATTLFSLSSFAQSTADTTKPDTAKELLEVEAACGQCRFALAGEGCDLAVRINGKAYFVDGTHIDQHGDAHAKDGFCNAIRKAKVQGELVNNRFKATYFQLVKDEPVKGKARQ